MSGSVVSYQEFDGDGNYLGRQPRECGEHRTVGPHRAWCFDCHEWCYPANPCVRCEVPQLRAAAATHVVTVEQWVRGAE